MVRGITGLKLGFEVDGAYVTIYEYHPSSSPGTPAEIYPFGRITSDGYEDPVEYPADPTTETTELINKWITDIRKSYKLDMSPLVDLDLELTIKEVDSPSVGSISYEMKMGSLRTEAIWNSVTDKYTFERQDSFELSWQAFLCFNESLRIFIASVNKRRV